MKLTAQAFNERRIKSCRCSSLDAAWRRFNRTLAMAGHKRRTAKAAAREKL